MKYQKRGTKIELDIYIPAIQLALEYQGEQHYHRSGILMYSLKIQQERDAEKKKVNNWSIELFHPLTIMKQFNTL